MSTSYIGSKISLISKSEIRYEGILYTVDPKESTIALAKVKTFGTENRATEHPMPPRNDVFEYIIFKASDIKDIVVCETPQPVPQLYGGLPYDPAIVSVSKTAALQNLQQQPLTNDLSLNATNAQKFVDNSRLSSRSITPVNHQKLISAYETVAQANVGPQNRAPGAGRRESNSSAVSGGQQQQHQHQKGGLGGGGGAGKPFVQSQQRRTAQGGGANDDDDESVDDSRSRGSFHSRDAQFGLYRSRGMYRRGNTTRTGAFIRNDQEFSGGGTGGGGGFRSGGNFDRPIGGGVRSAGRGIGSGFTHDFDRFRTTGGGRGGGTGGGGGGFDRAPRGMTGGAGNRFEQSNSHRMRGGGGGNAGGGGGFISRGFLSSRGGNRAGPGGGNAGGGGAGGQDGQNRRFDSDYDFEKANEKFQETMNHLREDVSKTKLDDSKENCSESSLPNASQAGDNNEDEQKSKNSYNREKSFFDSISCEALETLDGGNSRPNWRRERELNQETFGQTGFRNYQFRRGVGRMGGGGGPRGGGGFRRGGTSGGGGGGFGSGGGGESRNY